MRYFLIPGGGVAYRDDEEFIAPPKWRPIDEVTYNARKADLSEARALRSAERREDLNAQVEADYRSLRDLGVSETLAGRLTGYRPVAVEAVAVEAVAVEAVAETKEA